MLIPVFPVGKKPTYFLLLTVSLAKKLSLYEIPDGGKIILQKAVEVMDGDTPEMLQKRVMEEAEWQILPMAIDLISKEQKNTCKM